MNGQQFDQALKGKVSTSIFNPPVLNSGNVVIEGEILMAGIAFFLAQFRQLEADALLEI